MPFLSCSTNTAQQAALAAAQATQDAAIAALQSGVGVTPAAVASAVDAMTPAQLAAMCAKLNCQPTAAALTAALLGLPGSGVAGSVLTIVGGAPMWQAPVAPAAATDNTAGVTALNLGTAAGDATNNTDALTAAGFVAMMQGDAPNPTPNPLQASVGSNPSQYATAAQVAAVGVGAPTAAPTAANPATVHTNTNGEVFRWDGTVWGLSENGYTVKVGVTPQTVTSAAILASITAPRSGTIIITGNAIQFPVSGLPGSYSYLTAHTGSPERAERLNQAFANFFSQTSNGQAIVTAGQPVSLLLEALNAPVAAGFLEITYIK